MEPHDLTSVMAIVERLEDFKQGKRPRSPRHERAKDRGDGRSKSGLPKAIDDERSMDKGRCRHYKEEKKHEGSRKQGDSCDHKAHVGPRGGCFYCTGPHYRRDCPHKGKMIAFLEKHKCSNGDSSSSVGEARMGALQMVNAFSSSIDSIVTIPSSPFSSSVTHHDRFTTATLTKDVLQEVHELTSSRDVWLILELRFLDQSTAKELQLKLQLQSLKKGHQSMAQYLRTLKSLANSLSAINSPVSNKDLVIYALAGLSSGYESFITNVTNNNTVLSFDDLRTRLLYHEQRLNHLHGTLHNETETALLAAPRGRGRGRGRDHSSFGCGGQGRGTNSHIFLDGQSSHLVVARSSSYGTPSSAPNLPDHGRGLLPTPFSTCGSPSRPLLVCQICSKQSHSALSYYNRFNHSYTSDDLPRSFSAMTIAESFDAQWYPDSGASTHMTPNDGMLFDTSPYTGSSKILVGNGSLLRITKVGSSFLHTPHGPLKLHNVLHVPQLARNLLSISRLCRDNDCSVNFSSTSFSVKDNKAGTLLLSTKSGGDLYPFPSTSVSSHFDGLVAARVTGDIWHQRLGHSSSTTLSSLHNKGALLFSPKSLGFCSRCHASVPMLSPSINPISSSVPTSSPSLSSVLSSPSSPLASLSQSSSSSFPNSPIPSISPHASSPPSPPDLLPSTSHYVPPPPPHVSHHMTTCFKAGIR
ncbi:hypothetical protein RJ640_022190 [Escallonia rubra]|uniref:Cytochrome c domain-containing protein n=1 Tax=Escallonia rubra TaxID=112253 RepID=A0AA88QY33_9ASTE|nr:hypothetical protein RJ640_022190 [Escallonia rubra]